MLHLLILVTLYPAPIDPRFPMVCLEDTRQFGIDPASCRRTWLDSRMHKNLMLVTVAGGWNNTPDVCRLWEEECDWRERCWYLLDDAMYAILPLSTKLKSLDELRRLIGDADYYGGRMPAPFPSYR